jgi:hypothetical protein
MNNEHGMLNNEVSNAFNFIIHYSLLDVRYYILC